MDEITYETPEGHTTEQVGAEFGGLLYDDHLRVWKIPVEQKELENREVTTYRYIPEQKVYEIIRAE